MLEVRRAALALDLPGCSKRLARMMLFAQSGAGWAQFAETAEAEAEVVVAVAAEEAATATVASHGHDQREVVQSTIAAL